MERDTANNCRYSLHENAIERSFEFESNLFQLPIRICVFFYFYEDSTSVQLTKEIGLIRKALLIPAIPLSMTKCGLIQSSSLKF